MLEKACPRRGQSNAPGVADTEFNPKFGFQGTKMFGESRLGYVKPCGGLPQTPRGGDLRKIPELTQFHGPNVVITTCYH